MVNLKSSRESLKLFFERAVNKTIYFLALGIEAGILLRFYSSRDEVWSQSSFDFQVQVAVILVMTPLIFVCLWRASTYDCGRLPREEIDRESDTADIQTCHKCGALRSDPFVHHCSTCDACIELMDHHCFFLGQCVGKKNMKYFLQFCSYLFLLLAYATYKLLTLFYT